jgi:hypothetical protein
VNDWHIDSAFADSVEYDDFWKEVYKKAFPNFRKMKKVETEKWQKRGVDRVIWLSSGHYINIDEKLRRGIYSDILLEFVSNDQTRAAGWVEKELWIDYLAYGFMGNRTAYIFPWVLLHQAWMKNKKGWLDKYRIIHAVNNGYKTVSVTIPISVLMSAVCKEQVIKIG